MRRRFTIERHGATVVLRPYSRTTLRVVVLSDIHVPFHDPAAVELAVKITQWIDPHVVVLNGDIVDFYGISKFPSRPLRRFCFHIELHAAHTFLRMLREAISTQYVVYLAGNHEERLRSYLWMKAKELAEVEALRVPALLKLESLGIEYLETLEEPKSFDEYIAAQVRVGKLFITHGHAIRSSGNTVNVARTVFLKTMVPLLIGHWHRTQHYEQTSYDGSTSGCWVAGCLCYPRPHYDAGRIWGQGIAVITATQNQFRPEVVSFFRQQGKLHAIVQGTHFEVDPRKCERWRII